MSSADAAVAAGKLAKRLNETLYLVHALETASAGHSAVELMSHAAGSLRSMGVNVAECIEAGSPQTVLPEVAARTNARLIVLGAPEPQSAPPPLLGRTAVTVAQESPTPVLTVRDPALFDAWIDGTRALRVIVTTDLSSASQAAVDWVGSLRGIAPVDVVLAHVFWPPAVHARLELPGPVFRRKLHPVVKEVLERELAVQASTLGGSGRVDTWLRPNLGRTADPLVLMASQQHADLLVMGTHQRKAFDRMWYGSVSRALIRMAPMSVACVPIGEASQTAEAHAIRTIVAATDFSPTGNLAVAHAYSIVQPGSRVILMHAMKFDPAGGTEDPMQRPAFMEADARLKTLVPRSPTSRGVSSETHVLEGYSVSATICGAAERFGADVLVLGTEGRTGFARPIFGSVAQEVILRSRCPVLIVPPAHVLRARLEPRMDVGSRYGSKP